MIRRTTQDKTYSGIKLKIYSTMLLYSKERKISINSTELQKVELAYNKR